MTSRRRHPEGVNRAVIPDGGREDPAELPQGHLPPGGPWSRRQCPSGQPSSVAETWGTEEGQAGGTQAAPWSPSVLLSRGSWAERAQLTVPLSAQGRRWIPPHPFFSLPQQSHHPPVSGAATLQLFYPSVSDSKVLSKAPAVSARCSHKRPL